MGGFFYRGLVKSAAARVVKEDYQAAVRNPAGRSAPSAGPDLSKSYNLQIDGANQRVFRGRGQNANQLFTMGGTPGSGRTFNKVADPLSSVRSSKGKSLTRLNLDQFAEKKWQDYGNWRDRNYTNLFGGFNAQTSMDKWNSTQRYTRNARTRNLFDRLDKGGFKHRFKFASNSLTRAMAESVVQQVYEENPSYWPYGLKLGNFLKSADREIHLLIDKKSSKPAAFVGWYEDADDAGQKIGYYSIGVLPEYRGQGLAKEAVRQICKMKAASVDTIRAHIVPHNKASRALAASLGIKVETDF
jgi:RimJ/RimL family protein N-acetyltransferase